MQKQKLSRSEEIKPVIQIAPGRQLELSRPLVMGVLNVTPDSFSDGRAASVDQRVERALQMIEEGADIIDIGGESTRPGAEPVPLEEELSRVIPVIDQLRAQSDIVISIDSYKAEVVRLALDAGAGIVNDISAFRMDDRLAPLVAERKAPAILMHMQGEPRTMQKNPHFDDCVRELIAFFHERIGHAVEHGIDKSKLILDPGIGFGKRLQDNLDILSRLAAFKTLGLPILVGASRKRFIAMLHDADRPAAERLGGSIAAAVIAVNNGAAIVRAHDVAPTVEALKVLQAVRGTR